jgi:hypothetical protein
LAVVDTKERLLLSFIGSAHCGLQKMGRSASGEE